MKKRRTITIIIISIITIIGLYYFSQSSSEVNIEVHPESNPVNMPLVYKTSTSSTKTYGSKVAIKLITNQQVELEDATMSKLFLSSSQNSQYTYALEFSNLGVGLSVRKAKILSYGNAPVELTLEVTRESYTLPFGLLELADWDNYTYTADGDNFNAIVSKKNKLITEYYPVDLVDLNKDYLLYTNIPGITLRKESADALKIMLSDLKKETGKDIVIASGFRSFNDQYKQYAYWVKELGQEEADKISARPGYSEHQLGTAIDFMSEDSGFDFTNELDKTVAGIWLMGNSYKYGFIQSYPEGKSEITGYNHEAWHYRYIGITNAKAVKDSGLTLLEWQKK